MKTIDQKLDKLSEDVIELRVAFVKQEANYEKAIEILDRLTDSVVEHVRRSDQIEELVEQHKAYNDVQLEKLKHESEKELLKLQSDLSQKKSNDRMIWVVLMAIGGVILGLHELGILEKLF